MFLKIKYEHNLPYFKGYLSKIGNKILLKAYKDVMYKDILVLADLLCQDKLDRASFFFVI